MNCAKPGHRRAPHDPEPARRTRPVPVSPTPPACPPDKSANPRRQSSRNQNPNEEGRVRSVPTALRWRAGPQRLSSEPRAATSRAHGCSHSEPGTPAHGTGIPPRPSRDLGGVPGRECRRPRGGIPRPGPDFRASTPSVLGARGRGRDSGAGGTPAPGPDSTQPTPRSPPSPRPGQSPPPPRPGLPLTPSQSSTPGPALAPSAPRPSTPPRPRLARPA